jgi:SAM-dependent methyltransferase
MLDATNIGETDALTDLARMVQATGYAFVTPTPATHARVLARPGDGWATDLRDVFGWSKPFGPGVVPAPITNAMQAAGVLAEVPGGWRSRVRLSSLDGLLFTHSAYPTTAADAVFFGPDTYRFARAIQDVLHAPVRRAVDIGCGAGPGAILVARAHPAAEVFAVDINDAALRMTRANAALAAVAVQAVHSDLLDALPGTFDLIVANPPYLVDPAERAYRHGGGPLGAGLSLRILDAALQRLAPGGTLVLYTGAAVIDGQDPFHDAAVARLAGRAFAWRYEEMDPDVFGEELEGGVYAVADRIAAVVLTVRRPATTGDHDYA